MRPLELVHGTRPAPDKTSPDSSALPPKLTIESVYKRFGNVAAVKGISLSLAPGQLLALLGPSGCGKTTTLRMVAGLDTPTEGLITIDGNVVADGRRSVEPERRKLGMVFQSYALWPHMTVFDNVAYGLRRARLDKHLVGPRVREVLELVGMVDFASRPATDLSGGQQQRVAVARALATHPTLLLFDEPLSNLDAVLRESMRFEIRAMQQRLGIAGIYVTHSQEEALAIADVVAVMRDGAIEQMGEPEELYTRPRTQFVARFVGLANILPCTLVELRDRPVVRLANGQTVEVATTDRNRERLRTGPRSELHLAIRPENLAVKSADYAGAGLRMVGEVTATTYAGNVIDYFVRVDGESEPVRVQDRPPRVAQVGERVSIVCDPSACILLED